LKKPKIQPALLKERKSLLRKARRNFLSYVALPLIVRPSGPRSLPESHLAALQFFRTQQSAAIQIYFCTSNGFFRDQRKGVDLASTTTDLFSPQKSKIKSVEPAKISKILVVSMNSNTEGTEEVKQEVLANRIANREFQSLNHVSPGVLPFLRNFWRKAARRIS
jgi:hypothetical protein